VVGASLLGLLLLKEEVLRSKVLGFFFANISELTEIGEIQKIRTGSHLKFE
jgi:hypothetical protein